MGKAPVAIVIARHGARLDAANKDWHLTSATPYDPPLSYGGWLQSRALGARIINQVRSLEEQLDRPNQGVHDPKLPSHSFQARKPKRRIIIHSSPFLRCVQTAIAVSSGISQNYNDAESTQPTYALGSNQRHGGVPRSAISSTQGSVFSPGSIAFRDDHHRCLLRVDAFLGEWLSPEYFEHITPPPRSERMVATAKTELLRREQSVIPVADLKHSPSIGRFPGGWDGSPHVSGHDGDDEQSEKSEVEPTASPANANTQAQRNRAGSYDSLSTSNTGRGRRVLGKINTNLPAIPDVGYLPPVPNYAISPSNPIPEGYVTHARDACVQVDYQWDSMREAQNWGNGGEYGEEWGTMHTRFSTGLKHMISWYENRKAPSPDFRPRRHSQLQFLDPDNDDDMTDTILVIVTHGAGCNALIGALSGEPTLVNFGTASFTLAVRKGFLKETNSSVESSEQRHPAHQRDDLENYRLMEVASTDHLRPVTSPATSVRSPTSSLTSPTLTSHRHRYPARASFSTSPFRISSLRSEIGLQQPWSIERPSTVPRLSTGLWNSISAADPSEDDLVPNFGAPLSATASLPPSDGDSAGYASKAGDATWPRQFPHRTLSQRGLWGSTPLNNEHTGNVSRRWTVTERP